VNPTGAFQAAAALRPDVISCSWGFDVTGPLSAAEQALAAAVAAAVAAGIVVVFSAGNCQQGFPVRIPAVFVHRFWPIPYSDSGGFRTPLGGGQ
jgi:subtilisin family serine protease